MKIKAQHLAELQRLITPVIERMPVSEYRRLHPEFSDKRVRWDYFNATGTAGLALLCQEIYPYASDEHFDTALRAVIPGGER